MQIEHNLITGDSTLYKIKWENDCRYSLNFMSTSERKSRSEIDMLKKYKLTCNIVFIASTYLVYNMYLDKMGTGAGQKLLTDTAWLNPVSSPSNQQVFEVLIENPADIQANFKETSDYAIIYLYRPAKPIAVEDAFSVFIGSDFVYLAQNKTKIAYKVYTEGPMKFSTKSSDGENSVTLDIKFGKKYFLECIPHPKIPKALPEIRLEENADGQIAWNIL